MLLITHLKKLGSKMIHPITSDEKTLLKECFTLLKNSPLKEEACSAIWVDPRTEVSSKPKTRP